jgi:hypothetical protein
MLADGVRVMSVSDSAWDPLVWRGRSGYRKQGFRVALDLKRRLLTIARATCRHKLLEGFDTNSMQLQIRVASANDALYLVQMQMQKRRERWGSRRGLVGISHCNMVVF